MPGVNGNADDYFIAWLKRLEQRIQAIATQQSGQITNASGTAVVDYGWIPGTNPPQYGYLISDSAGHPRVQLGLLPDGDYGLAVWNPTDDGTYVELSTLGFGLEAATVATGEETTSTTYGDLTTPGPSVTVEIGSSGRALLNASALILTNPGDFGHVGLSVDGGAPAGDWMIAGVGTAGGYGTFPAGASTVLTGLAAGSHTFELKYKCNSGAGSTFQNRALAVQPF